MPASMSRRYMNASLLYSKCPPGEVRLRKKTFREFLGIGEKGEPIYKPLAVWRLPRMHICIYLDLNPVSLRHGNTAASTSSFALLHLSQLIHPNIPKALPKNSIVTIAAPAWSPDPMGRSSSWTWLNRLPAP